MIKASVTRFRLELLLYLLKKTLQSLRFVTLSFLRSKHSEASLPTSLPQFTAVETGKVLYHAITMVWDSVATINFISHINHDSLTFIMRVMGLSYGRGDSSSGDKCCYLVSVSTEYRKSGGKKDSTINRLMMNNKSV